MSDGQNSNVRNRIQAIIDAKEGSKEGQKALTDIRAGIGVGEAVLGPEGLGRIGEQQEIKDILARYKRRSEEGLAGAEFVAEREKRLKGVSQSEATAMRGLQARLARSGVRGGMAGGQMSRLLGQTFRDRADIETDLMLKSAEMKRGAFDKYAESQANVSGFDLQQMAKEKSMVLGAGTSIAQLGAAERGAAAQMAAIRGMQTTQGGSGGIGGVNFSGKGNIINKIINPIPTIGKVFCHEGNTEVLMKDGSYKKISNISLGDEVEGGGKVICIGQAFADDNMYEFENEYCSASHLIYTGDTWERADTLFTKADLPQDTVVYPMATETGIYITKSGLISGDIFTEEHQVASNEKLALA